mgnify:CR=1 FL=1
MIASFLKNKTIESVYCDGNMNFAMQITYLINLRFLSFGKT